MKRSDASPEMDDLMGRRSELLREARSPLSDQDLADIRLRSELFNRHPSSYSEAEARIVKKWEGVNVIPILIDEIHKLERSFGEYRKQVVNEMMKSGDLPAGDPPKTGERVNHPAHYNTGGIEVIDAIEAWGLGFNLGNAVKYIARAGKKDPKKYTEDLEKARWYLWRHIQKPTERSGKP